MSARFVPTGILIVANLSMGQAAGKTSNMHDLGKIEAAIDSAKSTGS
jgi:hypothetical protein